MIIDGEVDPALSRAFPLAEVGDAHQLMHENAHPPGNMSILVNATEEGETDIDLG